MANNPPASDTWRQAVDLPSERGSNRRVTDELLAQLGAHGWPEADRAVDRATRRFGSAAVRPASLLG